MKTIFLVLVLLGISWISIFYFHPEPHLIHDSAESLSWKRNAVRDAARTAFAAYEKYAWGFDQLSPISLRPAAPPLLNNMGATIIDSLSTLHTMGLFEEFNKSRQWIAERPHLFDTDGPISFFEATIRLLGGLLSAYDLSHNPLFLERAKDIGDRLIGAYKNSPLPPFPTSDVDFTTGDGYGTKVSLASIGSNQLEFCHLSYLTRDDSYCNTAVEVYKTLAKSTVSNTFGGLFPVQLDLSLKAARDSEALLIPPPFVADTENLLSFGASSDSFYEYLLKLWILRGKQVSDSYLRALWDRATSPVNGMVKYLLKYTSWPTYHAYLGEHNIHTGTTGNHMHSLTCFAGGNLVYGSRWGPQTGHLAEIGKALTETCWLLSERMAAGLAPEVAYLGGFSIEVLGVQILGAYLHNGWILVLWATIAIFLATGLFVFVALRFKKSFDANLKFDAVHSTGSLLSSSSSSVFSRSDLFFRPLYVMSLSIHAAISRVCVAIRNTFSRKPSPSTSTLKIKPLGIRITAPSLVPNSGHVVSISSAPSAPVVSPPAGNAESSTKPSRRSRSQSILKRQRQVSKPRNDDDAEPQKQRRRRRSKSLSMEVIDNGDIEQQRQRRRNSRRFQQQDAYSADTENLIGGKDTSSDESQSESSESSAEYNGVDDHETIGNEQEARGRAPRKKTVVLLVPESHHTPARSTPANSVGVWRQISKLTQGGWLSLKRRISDATSGLSIPRPIVIAFSLLKKVMIHILHYSSLVMITLFIVSLCFIFVVYVHCLFTTGADIAAADGRHLLRPEVAESMFYMWRLTGNTIWRHRSWKLFQSIEKNCKVESGGYAGLQYVNFAPVSRHIDKMESFVIAETLKYIFLTLSDSTVLPLDTWVFNTEGHPFRIHGK